MEVTMKTNFNEQFIRRDVLAHGGCAKVAAILGALAAIMPRNMGMSQWLQLPEIARLFGLSEDSIKRLAKNHGLALRRVSPFAMPGTLESELVEWLKAQPPVR